MSSLSQSRCFQHVSREAVARCPDCERFYCRECVTEHDGRMICRPCLDGILEAAPKAQSGWVKAARGWFMAGLGFFLAVYAFYLVGKILLGIPSQFHNGVFLD